MTDETFAKGTVSKTYMKFAFPAVLTSLLMISAYLVDGVLIGQFIGTEGLASFNIVFPIFSFLVAAGIVIATGGSALIGKYLGEDKLDDANRVFNLSLAMAVIFSVILSVVAIYKADDIIWSLGATDILFDATREYFVTLAVFFAIFVLGVCLEFFVRNEGNAMYPVKITAVAVAVNVPITYLFLGVWGMGLGAAALGSGIAGTVSTALLVAYFFRKQSVMSYARPRFDLPVIKKILYNGSSEGLSEISVGIVVLFFNLTLLHYLGEAGVAAFAIISFTSLILIMVYVGLSMALQPMVSYNFGAKKMDRVRGTLRIAVKLATMVGIAFYAVIFAFGDHFIVLFSAEDGELTRSTFDAIRVFGLSYVFIGVNYLATAYLTALQRPKHSLAISLSCNLVLVLVGLAVLPEFFGADGIWWAVPFANIATIFISIYCIRRVNGSMKHEDVQV